MGARCSLRLCYFQVKWPLNWTNSQKAHFPWIRNLKCRMKNGLNSTFLAVHSVSVRRRLRQQTWCRRDVTVRTDHGFDSGLHPAGDSVILCQIHPALCSTSMEINVHHCTCSLKCHWLEVLADFASDVGHFAIDGFGSYSDGNCCSRCIASQHKTREDE